ncbi:radical SAM protein [Maridesulfovibrio frigidus]|uniref:radical SAM protein n=1 Tax=Maridesulfovibrio frigidus TaxID=340956 RepID=UPI0004E27A50|nr:radical SAM protein [Maridesulfovibrio frigidus]
MLQESKYQNVCCHVCENECRISQGSIGRCGRYENENGIISEIYQDKYLIVCPIKIETMPMLNFHPGGRFLQLSTVGCNFDCPGCISTVIVREMNPESKALQPLSPEQVIDKAIQNDCKGIAFLMNDPLAAFETFISVATLAKSKGLLVGCSSNGYFSLESVKRILPVIDFINIGIKGLSEKDYRACSGFKGFAPVLRNIKMLHEAGVHIELACIHKKYNGPELLELCSVIKKISAKIPMQVMRFIPLEGADPEQEPLIRETESFSQKMREFLDYVYVFNSPGTKELDSCCSKCGETVVHRDFYGPMGARLLKISATNLQDIKCPKCEHSSGICGKAEVTDFRENDFQGGYPFTRALEIVESILIAIGAENKSEVVHVWEHLLCNNKMQDLHHGIQRVDKYLDLIRSFGSLIYREKAANELVSYLEDKTALVKLACSNQPHRPRVYYVMGKPQFCIKGERFENNLVEICNGISVNKEIEISGRPGMTIDQEIVEKLNPEIIFISAFISNSPTDFYNECVDKNIRIDAVRNKRIHTAPIPSSDFGGPRWILGLMNIANEMYKGAFAFDISKEAEAFHNRFYGGIFNLEDVNRSFGKPDSTWTWGAHSIRD